MWGLKCLLEALRPVFGAEGTLRLFPSNEHCSVSVRPVLLTLSVCAQPSMSHPQPARAGPLGADKLTRDPGPGAFKHSH